MILDLYEGTVKVWQEIIFMLSCLKRKKFEKKVTSTLLIGDKKVLSFSIEMWNNTLLEGDFSWSNLTMHAVKIMLQHFIKIQNTPIDSSFCGELWNKPSWVEGFSWSWHCRAQSVGIMSAVTETILEYGQKSSHPVAKIQVYCNL